MLALLIIFIFFLSYGDCCCPENFIHYKGSCFYVDGIRANRFDKWKKCQSLGAELAFPTDNSIGTYLLKYAKTKTFFVGLYENGDGSLTNELFGYKQNVSRLQELQRPLNSKGSDCVQASKRYGWRMAACNARNRFVCELPPEPATKRSGAEPSCPKGSTYENKSCYQYHHHSLDYPSAYFKCRQDGGHIARELTDVAGSNYVWLGFTDLWDEGSLVDYQGHAPANPDWHLITDYYQPGPGKAKVYRVGGNGRRGIGSVNAHFHNPGPCQMLAKPGTKCCPDFHYLHNGKCYSEPENPNAQVLYEDAQLFCRKSGSALAMPRTEGAVNFLGSLVAKWDTNRKSHTMWIGFTKEEDDGRFTTEDGTELAPTDPGWYVNGKQPDVSKNQKCVVYSNEYAPGFRTADCEDRTVFIVCQLNAASTYCSRRESLVDGKVCYYYTRKTGTFEQGVEYCLKVQGYLMPADTNGNIASVLSVKYKSFWINVRFDDHNNRFVDLNTYKTANIRGWQKQKSSTDISSPTETCGQLRVDENGNAGYSLGVCTSRSTFVCEIDLSEVADVPGSSLSTDRSCFLDDTLFLAPSLPGRTTKQNCFESCTSSPKCQFFVWNEVTESCSHRDYEPSDFIEFPGQWTGTRSRILAKSGVEFVGKAFQATCASHCQSRCQSDCKCLSFTWFNQKAINAGTCVLNYGPTAATKHLPHFGTVSGPKFCSSNGKKTQ